MVMGGDKAAKEHISSMSECLDDAKPQDLYLRKSQSIKVIGKYDYDKREGNMESGHQGEIMAIAMMLVEIPRDGLSMP